MTQPIVLTIASRKGGVTKTSSALTLAALLALRLRVIVVDLDEEAYATTLGLGQEKAHEPLIADPVRIAHRSLAAAGGELLLLAGGDAIGAASEQEVARHLARAATLADVVIVDTPPNGRSGALTAALRAASAIVVPMTPDFPSLQGAERLIASARTLGVRAPVRTLLSRWEPRTVLAQDVHRQLVTAQPGLVLSAVIPKDQRMAEAMAAGCPVPLYARRAPAVAAFRTATYEVAALAGLSIPVGAI